MSNEILHIVSITVDLHEIFSTMSGPKFPELCPFIETIIYPYRIVYVATLRAMKIYIVKEVVSQTTSIASGHLNDFLWFTSIPATLRAMKIYIVKEIVSQTTSIASGHLNDFLWFTLIPVTKQV
mgnify:FL=1